MILFYIKWTHLVTVPDVTGCTLKHCPGSAETVLSPVNSVHVNEVTEDCPGFCGHQPRLVVSLILAGHNERRGIPALCGVRCVVCVASLLTFTKPGLLSAKAFILMVSVETASDRAPSSDSGETCRSTHEMGEVFIPYKLLDLVAHTENL